MTDGPEGVSGKRVGPPAVPPVTIGGIRFEALHWTRERGLPQNGGYVAALEAATGKELWTARIYEIVYDPALESDVQDVFIRSMSRTLFGGRLKITDERGRRWLLDPATRKVEAR